MQPEFFKSMAGFLGATVSFFATYFADAVPASLQTGFEGVTSLSVIGCLIYAIKHLNSERTEERRLREMDRERWEAKWAEEHADNIAAREKDREVREKFAAAVNDLARAVNPDAGNRHDG